ncbi:MAG: hypothetical protein WCZ65_00165 [Lysobacteraceae bacterium]
MLRNTRKTVLSAALAACLFGGSAHAVSFGDWFDDSWAETSGVGANKGLVTDYVADLNQLIFAFFTYDQNGDQVWLTNNFSPVDGQSEYTLEAYRFTGGRFDANGAPTAELLGSVDLRLACDSIEIDFTPAEGSGLSAADFTFERSENVFGGKSKAQTYCATKVAFEGCPSGTTQLGDGAVCELRGRYTDDLHLTSNATWVINGGVFIGEDVGPDVNAPSAGARSATLRIDPGTTVAGAAGRDVLVIERGSKILALGTAARPVIMTSAQGLENGDDHRGIGEWGGLVINGRGILNTCTSGICEADGEADTGRYGGNDRFDNSGSLRYVSVRHAGFQFTDENELNGIAFQGVGAGTKIEYIHVHLNADDGVEFFGGNVNAKHIALTGNGDDSLDWTHGWDGKVQYVLIKQFGGAATGDRGIEADNLEANNDASPRSQPMLANFTIIGAPGNGRGVTLRRGTGANLYNFIITNAGHHGLDLDDPATFAAAGTPTDLSGVLTVENSIVSGNTARGNFADSGSDAWLISDWFNAQPNNSTDDPQLGGRGSFIPAVGSPALGIGVVPEVDGNEGFFDQVDYAGAVSGEEGDWTAGWVIGLDDDYAASWLD